MEMKDANAEVTWQCDGDLARDGLDEHSSAEGAGRRSIDIVPVKDTTDT